MIKNEECEETTKLISFQITVTRTLRGSTVRLSPRVLSHNCDSIILPYHDVDTSAYNAASRRLLMPQTDV